MSVAGPPPSATPTVVQKRPPVLRRDLDFLPAALEILETPPAPNKTAFLLTICAFVASALVWSYFGRIDIIASARGKVQPTGRVKIVQPIETGKVVAIPIRNGQVVTAGQTLLAFDAADAQADERSAVAALASWRAEQLRRSASLRAATDAKFAITGINWPDDIPRAVQEREDRVLAGDVAQLAATVGSLDAQIESKDAERKRLVATVAAQSDLISVLQQRVDMRSGLVNSGASALAGLIDARESLSYHSANLASVRGQLEESITGVKILASDRAKTINTFIADNRQRLGEAERQADEFEQRVAKARARIDRLTLRAPADGTITAVTVAAVGQVVTTGEEVMRIVPSDAKLEIEAYLENKDIGFVKTGQTAEVKIESFPFTRFGTINATVTRISHDAIPEQDAQSIESDPARSSKSSGFAGAQRTQNLVFPITLSPTETAINVEGQRVPISPGMAVLVEVRTGSRRILEYIFSPLVETASKAMKER